MNDDIMTSMSIQKHLLMTVLHSGRPLCCIFKQWLNLYNTQTSFMTMDQDATKVEVQLISRQFESDINSVDVQKTLSIGLPYCKSS